MQSIRPPAPKPSKTKRGVAERVRTWSQTPTGCTTCNKVRSIAGKAVEAVTPKPKR